MTFKLEIRISKFETIPKFEIPMFKTEIAAISAYGGFAMTGEACKSEIRNKFELPKFKFSKQ